MSASTSSQTVLICYDGSEPSLHALQSVGPLLGVHQSVVLTVWQPLSLRLSESGGFGVYALDQESEVDSQEERAARSAAEEGARLAQEAGVQATARVEQASGATWQTIIDVADEIDAALIVCATRGRGTVKTALLGSVSQAVLRHAGRPVLITPEKHRD